MNANGTWQRSLFRLGVATGPSQTGQKPSFCKAAPNRSLNGVQMAKRDLGTY